jgi:hypothetical protein
MTLTLIQTVAAPVIAPRISAPASQAVTGTIAPSTSASGTSITIPAGVTSVTITAVGGAGGKGGDDGNIGKSGTTAGRVAITIAVSPGDVLGLFAGNAGSAGSSGTGNAGGSGGADTLPQGAFSINGTYFQSTNFGGGAGGAAGSQGSSGSGGGAGAASIATINSEIVAIAGGAGGGGGAGTSSNGAVDWNGTLQPNGTNFNGSSGTSLNFSNSCPGSNQNGDGGGGGGGGGGYYGGLGGTAPMRVNECSGTSGSPGGNYFAPRASLIRNDLVPTTTEGSIFYSYDIDAVSACSTTSQTVDIYTIQKITTTANCTWTVPSNVSVIDIFLVGGGGGGGGDGGGGGGGGAALSRSAIPVASNSSLNLKVGYGGAGGSWGYHFNPISGDSTTVTLATGTTFSALGGSGGAGGPSGAGGLAGVAANGGFSGGAGGAGGSCYNVGTTGARGVSNYFYGTVNTYAGGGGGGSCPNGAATTGAAGADGGGTGGYASSGTVNQPGSNGTANLGGGGGGGLATGTGLKLQGGKGGSGVILIRYATNELDAFPASVASALSGRWTPNELQILDSSRKGWIDASGVNATAAVTGSPTIAQQSAKDSGFPTGSSITNLAVSGNSSAKTTLISGALSNYTLMHIARYPKGATTGGRIVTANTGNFISGHYNFSYEGGAHHNSYWITPSGTTTQNKWLLSTDMTKLYRANGRDLTYKADNGQVTAATPPTGLGINNFSTEPTDWQVLDLLVFNRQLTNGEIRAMETYLARVYGLSLDVAGTTSDTDTAATMGSASSNYYFFNSIGVGNTLNDTFTVEAWIKPTTTCDSAICQIVVKENTILFGIHSGILHWALYGTGKGWTWTTTGIRIKPDEWSHVSMVKELAGDLNGSLKFYLNGRLAFTQAGSPYAAGTNTNSSSSSYKVYDPDNNWYLFGGRADQYFYGDIDEIKIWSVARTESQVRNDMTSNDGSSPNMQMYYNFNMDASTYPDIDNTWITPILPNLAAGGVARTDLYTYYGSAYPTVENRVTDGPYTRVTFPRTIITKNGGWKAPTGIETVTALIVGGGGGGGYNSGGGGSGGGVLYLPTIGLTDTQAVVVGVGGKGADVTGSTPLSGESSQLGAVVVAGGNPGQNYAVGVSGGSGVATSTGTSGAGGRGTTSSSVPGSAGGSGLSNSITGAATIYAGGGGGGGWDASSNGGAGGAGGGGAGGTTSAKAGNSGTANTGGGGGGSSKSGFAAGYGGSGLVIIRYITALKPSYTKPSIAYLNVGMTETFTTNVAVDSATAGLVRTFKWESTTPTSNGSYTTLKVGTGASNAAYSWVPSDTSTTGSGYLYRLTVTDSDTAGLFITDSSTAYAVINPALNVTSTAPTNTLAKKINISRSETFTITLGTPTYRATLSPVIPGITIDTSTAGSVILRIGDTATVGTWLETLTVTDSVAASVVIPLTINIAAPPTLLNSGEIVGNGLVLNLDAGNSQSLLFNETTTATNAIWRDLSGNGKHAQTSGTFDSRTCTAPVYSPYQGGYMNFNGSTDCFWSPYIGYQMEKSFTVETWFKLNGTTLNTGASIITQNYSSKNINFVLGDMLGNNTITVAFYEGTWRQCATGFKPTNGVWNHIVGTYDGANMIVYVNGVRFCTTAFTGGLSTNVSFDGTFIGRRHDGGSTYYANGSIATARVYRIPLTETQVAQNFNATKIRFDQSNLNMLIPLQKYGAKTIESFTATSGYETGTVTLAVGDRNGIDWDTATVLNQINLTIQESLTVGTYLDTVTVTDSLGQSTYLPLKMTVTKADTLTVYVDTPTALSYTGNQANFTPVLKTIGAVGLESGTGLSATLNFKPGGTTCATGGYCRVGDIGPAGGVIFIDTSTASSNGRIFEAAPQNWSGSDDLASVAQFCIGAAASSNISNGSQFGIGWGETLTANFDAGCTGGAAQVAADLSLNGYSDWFVPSENEAVQLYTYRNQVGLIQLGSNWSTGNWGYWTSTENSASIMRVISNASGWSIGNVAKNEATKVMLRPVRSFKPCWAVDTCTSLSTTETPTAAGLYNITPSALTNISDLLTKYTTVTYAPSTVTINKVAPAPINIPWINTSYPDTFTVTFTAATGNQVIRYSTTNGTASGCTFDYKKIYTTSQGTCTVTITRAADRNFTADTTTATILFLTFVNSQPTGQVGSGATIALNGATSLETSTVLPPSITGLSTLTLSIGAGGTFTITGTGFTGSIEVKFWRNKVLSATSGNGTTIEIPVASIGSIGAASGRISVTTSAGQAVSVDSLTITP